MVTSQQYTTKIFLKNRVPLSSIFFYPRDIHSRENFRFFQIRKNWKKKNKPTWQKLNSRVTFKQPKLVTLVNFLKSQKAIPRVLPPVSIKFNLFNYGAWRLWFLRQASSYFKKLEVTEQKNSFFASLTGLNRVVKKMSSKKIYVLNRIFKKFCGIKFKRDKHLKIFLIRFWKSFKVLVPKYFKNLKIQQYSNFFFEKWALVTNYKFNPIARSRSAMFKNNFFNPEIPVRNSHFLFLFAKKRNLSFISSPIKAWIRHKKRNIFLSAGVIVARRSILSSLSVEHAPFLQLFLHYGQFRTSTSALFSFFYQTQKSAASLIYNKTHNSFFAIPTLRNPAGNNFFLGLKNNTVYQKIHSYLFSLMDLTNLDLWQQRYRRVINSIIQTRPAYPVKTKVQQRFINFREYVQIRRQFLGLALRKYGYKNNNATRYATGQYFWAHHVLQKKILSLYQIKIPQFKQLVKQVYHTAYTCSKTMSLISCLEKNSNTLAYRYNFTNSLLKQSPLCYVFDTNVPFSNNTICQTLSKNKTGLLALYNPFVQNINSLNNRFCAWNYEKGHNLLPGFLSPRLFIQKLKKRQKLTSLQRKVGRCSWSKTITNIEWQSSNVNLQKYSAGITFAPLSRFHNIYANSYTINHKVISIIKLRTAA